MSQDIRSYFKKASTTSKVQVPKKKVKRIIDSDDEDVIECTPESSKIKSFINKNKNEMILPSSDSEDGQTEKPAKKGTLKPVNIDDFFSTTPIKQSKVEALPKGEVIRTDKKKKAKTKIGKQVDDPFEKTLMELDDDFLTNNLDVLDKTAEDALKIETEIKKQKQAETLNQKFENSGADIKKHKIENKKTSSKKMEELDADHGKPEIVESIVKVKQIGTNKNSPNNSNEEKRKRRRSASKDSTPKKVKLQHNDSGIDQDQEAFEKKRYSAMLYQKYISRAGPKMHGQKELPKGIPTCLNGLTFLRTGVLDSLDGEDFQNLTAEHGGRVVQSVSKKVNYVVVGEDAGPSKLAKAKIYNIPEINEDEFLDLILIKSRMKPKYSNKTSEESTESGVFSFEDDTEQKKQKIKEKDKGEKEKHVDKHRKTEKETNKNPSIGRIYAEEKNKNTPVKRKHEEKPNGKPNLKVPKSDAHTEKSKNGTTKKEKHFTNEKSSTSVNLDTPSTSTETDQQIGILKASKFYPEKEKQPEELTYIPKILQIPSNESLAWTDKYKPNSVQSIIGQQGDTSNMSKLTKWLSNWHRNQLPRMRKKMVKPSPWAKNDDGAYYKAALLSGPPGVGKTTTATLVSRDLGFDVVEFNASDTRSKRLLHEEVSQLLSTNTIAGFAAGALNTDKKRVLLMDEVDGMAGNEDRGGIQELINLIKTTQVPIICMCNDRNHQKMRSLVNYCFDLRFIKPRLEQIRGAMMSICFKEGLKMSPNVLSEIISGTGCDIRQTLNHLTIWSAQTKSVTLEEVQNKTKVSQKDTVLGPWEVVRKNFTESEQKNMSLAEKSRLFFYDYSLGPLFIQENYLGVTPKCPKAEVMNRVALTAESISIGDLIDAKIRSSNNWGLLEIQAMYSSVLPGHYMSGAITSRINFPGWLGKNSSANKRKRMLSELHVHSRMSTSGSILAMKLDYLMYLRNAIITPLLKHGNDGIQKSITIMSDYHLLREDLTNILELCHWKDTKNPFNDVDSRLKAAFTRAYNKIGQKLPFAPGTGFSKKNKSQGENPEIEENIETFDDDDEDEPENDDVNADSLIKIKTAKKKESSKTSSKSKKKKT